MARLIDEIAWWASWLTTYLADIISTVEFDHTGNYLATGDKGGRVVLFERNETVSPTTIATRPPRLTVNRRRLASTNSTQSSSLMSQNLTT
jgi:hypothetical protein